MHRSVDELLGEWEQIKDSVNPIPMSLSEALAITKLKDDLNSTVHSLQISKLNNDPEAEKFWTNHFYETYELFTKEYTFRILKRG